MQRITRRLEIDTGHRLLKHEGKCRSYHGHRFVFEVTCAADKLDDVGRVIDFSVIKSVFGKWLDDNWDHGMILQYGDPLIEHIEEAGSRLYVVPCSPTSENLARLAYEKAMELLSPLNVVVIEMACWETPNCKAVYP